MAIIKSTTPIRLSKTKFVKHVQNAGGMTDSMLVSCKEDQNLKPLWIKLELADEVHKNDPDTIAGLQALDQLGYLPNGFQVVLDNWPTVA